MSGRPGLVSELRIYEFRKRCFSLRQHLITYVANNSYIFIVSFANLIGLKSNRRRKLLINSTFAHYFLLLSFKLTIYILKQNIIIASNTIYLMRKNNPSRMYELMKLTSIMQIAKYVLCCSI